VRSNSLSIVKISDWHGEHRSPCPVPNREFMECAADRWCTSYIRGIPAPRDAEMAPLHPNGTELILKSPPGRPAPFVRNVEYFLTGAARAQNLIERGAVDTELSQCAPS